MKKLVLVAGLIGVSLLGFAQKPTKPLQEFKSPDLIQVDEARRVASTDQDGKALLREKLNLREVDDMKLITTEQDEIGFTHKKYQHYYKGVKVFGSEYSIHTKSGTVSHLSGNYSKIENLDVKAEMEESLALDHAKSGIEATRYAWEDDASLKPKGELMILDAATTGEKAVLVYKFDITTSEPFQRYAVFVDAKSGDVVMKYSKIHFADATGSAATRYSGTQTIHTDSYNGSYRLRDVSRGGGINSWDATTASGVNNTTGLPTGSSDYTDANNSWTAGEFHNTDKDDAALEAHFAAAATYDFFYSSFGRNSYNGSGATINSYINTNIESLYGYPSGYNDNAFWTGYGMVYGKGGSYDPLTTVDIAGHEIGHAYCEFTANLTYAKESGAINESLSDIWGTCVEDYTNTNYGTTKDLWNLGSEIGATFRSMSNPNAHGQPDTYGGTYWVSVTNCTPNNNNDQCGVHTNSGVGNHYFYILTVGKSGTNDIGNSYNVSGIGIAKAAAINWRVESLYMGASSTYANWRTYAIQSARDLYGTDSNEEIQVTNAWYAVGVGAAYTTPIGCVASPLTLTIKFDNYPEETSWNIKNSSGTTVTSGGTYGSQPDGSTLTINNLNLTAGDYTFTINDSYGDGICCSYGSGNYTLSSGSTTIVTGGSFASSETTSFCITGGADTTPPSAPSNLTASGITISSVNLSWSASTDNVAVTGYKVFQGSTQIGTVTTTSTTVNGLASGTNYTFSVRATDAANNESASSNTVNVTTLTPDTQAPSAPTGLAASNVTTNSLTLSWNASTDNVGVTGYDVYQNSSLISSPTGTSLNVTGLASNTTYSFTVRARDAAGNTSAQSSALNVTTATQTINYCSANGTNSSYEWIDLVQIGSINNATGSNGGYGNFTNLSTSLVRGTGNTIYFSAGFSGSTYTERWRVYIDFNQDGDFTDSGEQVVSGNTSNGNTYSATVTVPSSAALGSTRMRVIMRYGSNPSSCGSFTYGEVEDYTVLITSSGSLTGFAAADSPQGETLNQDEALSIFMIYPNPAKSTLLINQGELKEIRHVRIFDLSGRMMLESNQISDNKINISDLSQGLYLIRIGSERGEFESKFFKE